MVTKKQIKKALKIQVIKVEETSKRINVHMVYIDYLGRHEHTVDWDKSIIPNEENILDALWCDCTYCSNFNVKSKLLCILKIRAIKELIDRRLWPHRLWSLVEEYAYE